MRLIALMVVRNESWILGCSLRTALSWCDEAVVVDHNSTDGTQEIINEVAAEQPWRVHYSRWRPTERKTLTSRYNGETWEADVPIEDESRFDEMDIRQHSLLLGRRHGGTHFAMIDADELLTANLAFRARGDAEALAPGEVLEYPLFAMRSLDEYQNDQSDWCGNHLSLVFRDAPHLSWKPAADGYHFHSRPPWGAGRRVRPLEWGKVGGVMHLQFAHWRRLLAKHVWYRMVEHLRWPGRSTVAKLNEKYDNALRPPGNLTRAQAYWWGDYPRERINLTDWPWQEGEVRRLLQVHDPKVFEGLDLKGFSA